MLNGRSKGNWKSRRSRQSKDERKGGRTVKTAASAFFCVYGIIASSEGPSAWRQTCALPRCESRYFHTDRKKPIIRTHLLSETSSDYIGLVPVVGLEPTRGISPTDFESVTSANSITPARMGYYIILAWRRQYPGWGFCEAAARLCRVIPLSPSASKACGIEHRPGTPAGRWESAPSMPSPRTGQRARRRGSAPGAGRTGTG